MLKHDQCSLEIDLLKRGINHISYSGVIDMCESDKKKLGNCDLNIKENKTKFPIGCCFKPLLGYLLYKKSSLGELDLNDNIGSLYSKMKDTRFHYVSFNDILEMTSGYYFLDLLCDSYYTSSDAIDYLISIDIPKVNGIKYDTFTFNLILGYLMNTSDSHLSQLINNFFKQCNMNNTKFSTESNKENDFLLHYNVDNEIFNELFLPEIVSTISSFEDMIRFLELVMYDSSYKKYLNARIDEIDYSSLDQQYVLGWTYEVYKGKRIIYSRGEVEDFSFFCGFSYDLNMYYLSIVHEKDSILPELGYRNLIDSLFQIEHSNWYRELQIKRSLSYHFNVPNIPTISSDLSDNRLIGSFRNDKYSVIMIQITENLLKLKFHKSNFDYISQYDGVYYFKSNGTKSLIISVCLTDDKTILVRANKGYMEEYFERI